GGARIAPVCVLPGRGRPAGPDRRVRSDGEDVRGPGRPAHPRLRHGAVRVSSWRLLLRTMVALATIAAMLPSRAQPAVAAATVNGAGSTWSQIAVDQWRADVARQGLTINYQGVGSTAGRVFYYQDQVAFAVSEIPFQGDYRDSSGTVVTNEIALAAHRPYA